MPPIPPDPVARRRSRWPWGLRLAAGLLIAAWSLLLLAMAVLHWVILPHASEWLPHIESYASRSLGVPLRIGDIQTRGGGWVPALELRDVVLLDTQQREALRLPRLSAAVSARSLLTLRLRLEQLVIEDAQLELRRDAQGRLHVAGLPLTSEVTDAKSDTALADWFFAQPEFLVRNARVRWTDELRGAEPVEVSQVLLLLRNGLRRHELRLDFTPPPAWGQRWSVQGRFKQPLLARASDFKRWRGTLHAELPAIDFVPLQQLATLRAEIHGGQGALRAWVEIDRGDAREVTLDLALRELSLRLPGHEPLALAQLQGRLTAQRDGKDLTLRAQQLGFTTDDGLQWPAGDTRLHLRRGVQPGGELDAERLDLALLARLATRVPLPEGVEARLRSLAPEGVVTALEARWDGPLEQPGRYRVKGRVADLALEGTPVEGDIGQPGVRGLSAEFDASEAGGSARLQLARGALELPGVFEQPRIDVERFSSVLAWRLQTAAAPRAPKLEFHLREAKLVTADAQAEFNATWRTDAQGRLPGTLELDGRLVQGRAQAVARYLPLTIPADTRHWVAQAVQGGRIPKATFRVRGDLREFPFRRGNGEFRIAGQVEDTTLAYVPDDPSWPTFTQVGGELVFDRVSMALRNVRARVAGLGLELAGVNGGFADLEQAQLRIEGTGRGPAHDMLQFVNTSPVGGWINGGLKEAVATGNAELRLALQLPLLDLDQSTVQGSVLLSGNDVRLGPEVPLLTATRAKVEFTRQRMGITGGARVLGGDAVFEGGTQPDGTLRFSGNGVASAEGLRRAPELGFISRLAGAFSGQAPYRLQLAVRQGHPEFVVLSNLVGMGSELPEPLRKAAEAPLPLQVSTRVVADGAMLHEHWQVDAEGLLQGQLVRDLQQQDADGDAVLLRGGLGLRQPAPQPSHGFGIAVALPALDLDAWQQTWERLSRSAAAAGGPGAGAVSGASGAGHAGGAAATPPMSVALQVQQLLVSGRRLDHVVAGVTHAGGDDTWRANLHADQLDGHVEFRAGDAAQPGHVRAWLARLALPPSAAQGVESLLAQAPASVPALDIVVENFELGGRDLGKVEIQAVNRRNGPRPAEWQLDKLQLTTAEAELKALGKWVPGPDGRRRMVMDFRLELDDSGALLQRLGLGGVLEGGKGRLQGEVSWPGSPLAPDPSRMDGQLRVDIQQGRFLKAGAGAGRLLSVLSLQSIPRRLTLDFRDVFLQGFAFDNVTGDVHMDDGVAETNNLLMRGLQAAVLMEGRADIARETQDLHVVVVPEINAGTASLAYAAINPAVGLGTFLAQLFLRKPLMQAGTREFQVSGSWSDPQVERVERAPGKPLPDLAPSPPPAAAAAASSPRVQN
ncbi:YhdP family protein [uncultured Azohydromonas sp.]|uniref:YhdP family protein n=1 Tax=uncultured Azohydromonas sp. TaxID=487342 RepID=UPI002602AAB5|nr:YhdP family protein [uncultured Azohydromonas sp.]